MPSSEELEQGECRYCGRALVPTPAPVFVQPRTASSAPMWIALGGVFAGGAALALVMLLARSSPVPSPPPLPPPPAPVVPLVSAATSAPLAPPSASTQASTPTPSRTTPQARATSAPATPRPTAVAVAVHRFDSSRVSAASLSSFVSPARRCFTTRAASVRVTLQFDAQGALQSARNSGGSGAEAAQSCAVSALNGLVGSTPTGYVGGAASSALVEIGS